MKTPAWFILGECCGKPLNYKYVSGEGKNGKIISEGYWDVKCYVCLKSFKG